MKTFNPVRVSRIFLCILVLAVVAVPRAAKAQTSWSVTLGAQSADAGNQAMAFLPNEIWIDAGDSVTWNSNTGEAHTVTFLQQPEAPVAPNGSFIATSLSRPNFQATGPGSLFGCAGGNQGGTSTTPPGTPMLPTGSTSSITYTGGTQCVNSGLVCVDNLQPDGQPDDQCPLASYTVTFENPGEYKLVCLLHSDMTGIVHVLAPSTPYPHDQSFYNLQASNQTQALLESEATPVIPADEVIMTGRLMATGGGKQYVALMRFLPETITVNVGATVEWTNLGADEPHTVTFLPNGGTEPPAPATPGGTPDPDYSSVDGTIPNGVGCGVPGATCFNSGLIGPASQDQLGLPQTPAGVQRTRITFTSAGVYDYYCILHDELGMSGKVIVLGNTPLVVTTGTLPTGTVGVPYSQQLVATGGTPPYNWEVIGGATPPGLALSSAGVLSGIPSSTFWNNFYVKVSDSGGNSVTPNGYYSVQIH